VVRGERTRSDDPGIIYFTSATTGNPKMVLHSQASYGLGHRLTGRFWLDLRPEDVHWNLSDLGWGKAAWSSFYGPWQMGACVFALDAPGKFDPLLALKTLAAFPITTWCAPPSAALRQRGRTAQPGSAEPLARGNRPDTA
jgi:acetyl-CoA synthetase/medium-chain acyl-CoA synthetase